MTLSPMTDEDLLDYTLIHSRTDLHLFAAGHVRRLADLAGIPVQAYLPAFMGIDQWDAEIIVKRARERLRDPDLSVVRYILEI